jgi:hypothetical protein
MDFLARAVALASFAQAGLIEQYPAGCICQFGDTRSDQPMVYHVAYETPRGTREHHYPEGSQGWVVPLEDTHLEPREHYIVLRRPEARVAEVYLGFYWQEVDDDCPEVILTYWAATYFIGQITAQ